MALTENTKLEKIELTFNGSGDVFIEFNNQILRDEEVISSTPHRYALSATDEQKLFEILGVSGLATKIAELNALISNE